MGKPSRLRETPGSNRRSDWVPSSGNQEAPRPAPRGPVDKNRCPAGWDAQLWHLTLLFGQYARADGIELRAGRHFVYAEINDLVTHHGLRGKTYPHEVRGCARRELDHRLAARCWFHWPPGDPGSQRPGDINWVQMVEVIMAEFWSRVQDEYALDMFRQHFQEYGKAAMKHWHTLAVIRDAAPTPRRIVRRVPTGATMTDASKEG